MSMRFTKSGARGIPVLDKDQLMLNSIINLLVNLDDVKTGATRAVYTLPMNPNVVLKVAVDDVSQNEAEFKLYDQAIGTSIEKYFAAIIACSEDYRAIIMQRTLPLNDTSVIPKKLPRIVNDIALHNMGMFQGKAVIHDYGINGLDKGFSVAMKSYKWENTQL